MASSRDVGVIGVGGNAGRPASPIAARGPVGFLPSDATVVTAACSTTDTPGTLGFFDRGATELPPGLSQPRAQASLLVLDTPQVMLFLRSVAYARASQARTRARWVEYEDSKVLNTIYTLMPWKGRPGWVEVDTGVQGEIEREAGREAARLFEVFLRKLAESPAAGVQFLEGMERVRDAALEGIRETFADAGRLNTAVIRETGDGIKSLAAIKLVSDVVIAFSPAFAVSLGYAVATTVIKEWHKASEADAIAFQVTGEIAKEVGEEAAEKYEELAAKHGKAFAEQVAEAERKIAFHADNPNTGRAARQIRRKIGKWEGRLAAARKGANGARMKMIGGKLLKFVFLADGLRESWEDAAGAWKASD